MQKFWRNYRYEFIAALSGAVVMMLELVGARMVAPYFGTSIYVWTAMIGVILGALSFGYWYGGKLADKAANDRGLAVIVSVAAVLVALSVVTQRYLLEIIATMQVDVRLQAVLAALILLAPASCLLGIVSPYVVKLRLSSLSKAGQSVGRLYAAGTAGSIIGTFATGYWLISWLGNYTLGLSLILLLLAISFIAETKVWRVARIGMAALAVGLLFVPVSLQSGVVADVDSAYSRYQVKDFKTPAGATIRVLQTDSNGYQSAYEVGKPDEPVLAYVQAFKHAADAQGPLKRMLMIGGGTYTFPSLIAREQPQAQIDVVEIDPLMDQIASDFFDYRQLSNLSLIHQDGRVYLNQNRQTYDMVYIDAFSSLSPPYQLATAEATQRAKQALAPGGVVVVNVLARPGIDDEYFAATYRTYQHVFESVKAYPVQGGDPSQRQNVVFVMGAHGAVAHVADGMRLYAEAPAPVKGLLLSDDHAPVDQLIGTSRF